MGEYPHSLTNGTQLALMYLIKPAAHNGYFMKTFNIFYLLSLSFLFTAQPGFDLSVAALAHCLPVGQSTTAWQTCSCLQCSGLVWKHFAT